MEVKFLIYNIIGQKIYESDLGALKEGDYEFEFLGNDFPSGVYIYVLFIRDIISGEVKLIKKKMILMK